ncbi:putative membrane protein [Candidatus Nanobsidianus stetteri]|uniref:Putative membrane protein n=1 Tax=Nanobsidianus stetteri TaxID=1294122 RepID=R1G3V9_NANST|nr:putative membrane protein [Candidatus Nanobsidianus stetteri]
MQKNNIAFLNLRNNLNYLQQTPHVKNLSSTRTIYHNYIPSYAKDIKVKNYDGFYFAFFMFFYIFIFQFVNVPFKLPVFIILMSISLFLIIRGFKRYIIHNILNNTPFSKIHIATYGLNKVKGRFIPYGYQPLKSPISGQDCIYYSISTFYVHPGGNNNSTWISDFIDGFDVGIPALFTDGTGFLAVDLEKAPIVEVRTNIIEIIPNNSQDRKIKLSNFNDAKRISDEILQYIKYAANNNTQVNLYYIKNYKFTIKNNKIRNLKLYVDSTELCSSIIHTRIGEICKYDSRNMLYLVEQYIPINEDYTIIGGFADTGEMINMKPVKVTVPDMSTGILEVHLSNFYRNEFLIKAVAYITLGIVYLITGIVSII